MSQRSLLALALLSFAGCASPAPTEFVLRVEHVGPDDAILMTPGWVDVGRGVHLYAQGEVAGPALERLAEEGDPILFAMAGEGSALPEGFELTYREDALGPGMAYEARVMAFPGETLSVVSMVGTSNDTFLGGTLPLFDEGEARSGDVSADFGWYDAGTEVDEPLGEGEHQPARAMGGPDEGGVVHPDDRGLPPVPSIVRVTLTPRDTSI